MPSRGATASMSTLPLATAPSGSGTHRSPLHAPSGLSCHPVSAANCSAGTWSSVVITGPVSHVGRRIPHPLGHPDERDAPQHVPGVPGLVAARALGRDQPLLFVEPQRRWADAGALDHLPDRQLMFQRFHLTSTLLEVLRSSSWTPT